MKTLKISPNFTIGDIHKLRIYIANKHSRMSEAAARRDTLLRVRNAEKTIEEFRKTRKS